MENSSPTSARRIIRFGNGLQKRISSIMHIKGRNTKANQTDSSGNTSASAARRRSERNEDEPQSIRFKLFSKNSRVSEANSRPAPSVGTSATAGTPQHKRLPPSIRRTPLEHSQDPSIYDIPPASLSKSSEVGRDQPRSDGHLLPTFSHPSVRNAAAEPVSLSAVQSRSLSGARGLRDDIASLRRSPRANHDPTDPAIRERPTVRRRVKLTHPTVLQSSPESAANVRFDRGPGVVTARRHTEAESLLQGHRKSPGRSQHVDDHRYSDQGETGRAGVARGRKPTRRDPSESEVTSEQQDTAEDPRTNANRWKQVTNSELRAEHPVQRRGRRQRDTPHGYSHADGRSESNERSSISSIPTSLRPSSPGTQPAASQFSGPRPKGGTSAEASSALFSTPIEEYQAQSPKAEEAAKALEHIAKIISDFPVDGDNDGKEALIPILIESIHCFRHDPLVADRALKTLRRFTVSAKYRQALGDYGAVETIVTLMGSHGRRVRIASQGCLALGNLCFHEQGNKERVLRHGIPAIVAAMAVHTDAEQAQAWGALAIRNCTNSLAATGQGPLGAIEVLVGALEMYGDSEMVASNAIAALNNIAFCQGKEAIVQAGGIPVLVSTLRANAKNTNLSELGLSLCVTLIEEDAICASFGNHGGVEVVTAIMYYHEKNAGIACLGAAVFRVLAFNAQNRKRFARCGTLNAVVAALHTVAVGESGGKVVIVMKALANILFDSSVLKAEAGRLRVLETTLLVMNRLGESEVVAEAGLRVIRNLTDQNRENGATLMSQPHGLASVVSTGRAHGGSSPGVAEHTVACLVNMSITRRFASQIKNDSDVVSLVEHFRTVHARNRRVIIQLGKLDATLASVDAR